MSGVTDCYQPVERKLEITRRCLEVLARFRKPVAIITKNALVARDIDLLAELARHGAVCVYLSITTLDPKLARILEPRASSPRARLAAMRALADAGIPVGPSAAPMIPGLNDHELPAILTAAKEAGASFAAYSMVRLPGAVAGIFENWLDRHFPDRKEKILNRIRASQGGALNNSTPGERMRGSGAAAGQLRALHHATCRRLGLATRLPELSTTAYPARAAGAGRAVLIRVQDLSRSEGPTTAGPTAQLDQACDFEAGSSIRSGPQRRRGNKSPLRACRLEYKNYLLETS